MHLVHQGGEAVGEVVQGAARGEVGLGGEEPGDQLQEFEPAAEGGDRIGDVGHQGVFAKVGDQADAG